MALAHLRVLIYVLLNEDPDMVPEEAPLIVLDSKSAVCMAKNGKYTKHTRHISFFSIPYKMHSTCNVSGMFVILTILSRYLLHNS